VVSRLLCINGFSLFSFE